MGQVSALKWGAVSITGNFRENNEDNCLVNPQGRYFLVADGMGGQSAGEKASELAVDLISERLDQLFRDAITDRKAITEAIDKAITHANGEIMALGELDQRYHSMGTTVAYVVAAGGKLYIGNVGDSRGYLLRDGKLEQLTRDHSLVQALIDAGTISPEEAPSHRFKNVLYRYLGSKEGAAGGETRELDPLPGDRLMLCSDGVTDGVRFETILDLLARSATPQETAERIVEAAQQGGSKDNITCVVVHVV